jgi:hypothetical protein
VSVLVKIKKLISLTLATTMIAGTVLSTHYMANETEKKVVQLII